MTNKSNTAGMNLGERIKHVGGTIDEGGFVKFGSVMAVEALVSHMLRDLQPKISAPCDEFRRSVIRMEAHDDAGKCVVGRFRGTTDPRADMQVLDAAIEFHYAAMRGVEIVNCKVGNLWISTVEPGDAPISAPAPADGPAPMIVYANFVCEDDVVGGKVAAPIKSVDRNDDGSISVNIDHWPAVRLENDPELIDMATALAIKLKDAEGADAAREVIHRAGVKKINELKGYSQKAGRQAALHIIMRAARSLWENSAGRHFEFEDSSKSVPAFVAVANRADEAKAARKEVVDMATLAATIERHSTPKSEEFWEETASHFGFVPLDPSDDCRFSVIENGALREFMYSMGYSCTVPSANSLLRLLATDWKDFFRSRPHLSGTEFAQTMVKVENYVAWGEAHFAAMFPMYSQITGYAPLQDGAKAPMMDKFSQKPQVVRDHIRRFNRTAESSPVKMVSVVANYTSV